MKQVAIVEAKTLKCPYHEGHVRIMDDACAMFNINIGRFC